MTKYRWFWVWDFEKEERWLNEMAANGWTLVEVGYCSYTFEKTDDNEYTVRLEMHPFDEDYISFMEQTARRASWEDSTSFPISIQGSLISARSTR